MFLENYKKFIQYYGQNKKLKLIGFVGLSLVAGFLELIGVALIYPFILLIISPKTIQNSSLYLNLNNYLPINNSIYFALLIGFAVLLLFILKNFFMIGILYLQTKFTTYWKRDITKMFMEFFMYAPYKQIMKISDSNKLFYMNVLSTQVIDGFVVRIINMIINVIIISMIILLLFVKFSVAAFITILFVSISMLIQNKFFKNKTTKLAIKMCKIQQQYNNIQVQNVYNLKDLKILSAEDFFLKQYDYFDANFRKTQIGQAFYSTIPPYIVEIFIVISLLLLGAIISFQTISDNSAIVASFAVIVAALFRIAPALNRIQTSIININASRDYVKNIINVYEKYEFNKLKINSINRGSSIHFNKNIEFKNVKFSYDDKLILKNINFEINKDDFIGIIGVSGAGKTTIADILMGLLPLDSGEILVDGVKLTENNIAGFRNLIGYVSQEVRVLEGSFRSNVAWGIENSKIDDERVIQSLKSAQLYDFVQTFSDGIYANPIVGTSGMSQGQKQRMAIARALYRNPDILILDEATSALDVVVEHEITEVLNNMSKSKTIIAIAHRLSTLKACNKLIYLKDGKIIDIGSFKELSEKYEDFNNLVKLSTISEKK